jgi:hypothetical protein
MKKVYCEDCKYLRWGDTIYCCDHPDNIKDNYLRRKNSYKDFPSDINQNNDCGWYNEKWNVKFKKRKK